MLTIGDKMPSFEVVDQDGKTVKSEDFIGKGRKTIIFGRKLANPLNAVSEWMGFLEQANTHHRIPSGP